MKNDLAYGLVQELKQRLREQGAIFLRVGKILKTIRDDKLYLELGKGGYDTFLQFLADPEIGLKQATAYMYIRIYEFYIEKLEMKESAVLEIPSYKLFRLLPLIKDKSKEEAIKAIDEVKDLGIADTEIVIAENHLEAHKRPIVYSCDKCKKWIIKYHEGNICQCNDKFGLVNEDI